MCASHPLDTSNDRLPGLGLLVALVVLPFAVVSPAIEVVPELRLGHESWPYTTCAEGRIAWEAPVMPWPYASRDSLELIPIAWTEPAGGGVLAVGDTDQDGLWELMFSLEGTFGVYENDGRDNYTLEHTGPAFIPWDVGDADGDGLRDVIGQMGNPAQLWESPTPDSHPSQLVWESPPLSNVFQQARIVDLDQDGKNEILLNRDGLGGGGDVAIFECTGDNSFEFVFGAHVSNGNLGWFAVEDFDRDGSMEFAVGDTYGRVHVYECVADNSYHRVSILSTGVWNLYYGTEAHDMDGNLYPEFVFGGDINSSWVGYEWTIFEAAGNDTYVVIDSIRVVNGTHGMAPCAVGNIDGSGREEIAVVGDTDLLVYEAVDVGTYVPVASQQCPPDIILSFIHIHDLNLNVCEEIVWAGVAPGPPYNPTLIVEDRGAYADLVVALAPADTVFPQGGTLTFDATLINLEATPETVDAWADVFLPGGGPYQRNPIIDRAGVVLAPYGSLTVHPAHHIPQAAPPGVYTYVASVSSSYPLPILAADSFAFRIVEPRARGESPLFR